MTIKNKNIASKKMVWAFSKTKNFRAMMLFIFGMIVFMALLGCANRPFGYALSPMETFEASNWTAAPTSRPTKTPKPTITPAPTKTPLPTRTITPTKTLPLDTIVRIVNQLSVRLNFSCSGTYSLSFYVSEFGTKRIDIPAGTYSCTINATGYDSLYKTQYWTAGEWDWTFSNQ